MGLSCCTARASARGTAKVTGSLRDNLQDSVIMYCYAMIQCRMKSKAITTGGMVAMKKISPS